jgi:3-hydroxybutyryl-CoA dehydrogenase
MTIVVTASDRQWEELTKTPGSATWQRIVDDTQFVQHGNADAYMNLLNDHIPTGAAALGKPVFINSVTGTLAELNAPENIFRVNGWTGFLQRPLWEIAGKPGETIQHFFDMMGKKVIFVSDEPGLVAAPVVSMIINEAYFALGDGVSTKAEIDIAMKLGTNYPFGPFEWVSLIGLAPVLQLLQKLNIKDKRYQPAPLLAKEATAQIS